MRNFVDKIFSDISINSIEFKNAFLGLCTKLIYGKLCYKWNNIRKSIDLLR